MEECGRKVSQSVQTDSSQGKADLHMGYFYLRANNLILSLFCFFPLGFFLRNHYLYKSPLNTHNMLLKVPAQSFYLLPVYPKAEGPCNAEKTKTSVLCFTGDSGTISSHMESKLISSFHFQMPFPDTNSNNFNHSKENVYCSPFQTHAKQALLPPFGKKV